MHFITFATRAWECFVHFTSTQPMVQEHWSTIYWNYIFSNQAHVRQPHLAGVARIKETSHHTTIDEIVDATRSTLNVYKANYWSTAKIVETFSQHYTICDVFQKQTKDILYKTQVLLGTLRFSLWHQRTIPKEFVPTYFCKDWGKTEYLFELIFCSLVYTDDFNKYLHHVTRKMQAVKNDRIDAFLPIRAYALSCTGWKKT